jgi:magnesium chelatase family protein
VTIARAQASLTFPAGFQLIAAANPCPCGHGEESRECNCTRERITSYAARLSGALADRFDIALRVEQPSAEAMAGDPGEASADVAARVRAARERAEERLGEGRTNGSMTQAELATHAHLGAGAGKVLAAGHANQRLSGRGWTRVLKVARTCADLDGSVEVEERHVDAALTLRRRGAA